MKFDWKSLDMKYKKIAVGIAFGVVVVGLVAFSIHKSGNDSAPVNNNVEGTATPSAEQGTTPTVTPTVDVKSAELKLNSDEKITSLVKQYFEASVKADVDKMNTIVSGTEDVTKEALERKYEYIEDVKSIDCYVLETPIEGAYIVYVYHEYKFVDIDTLAPGMSRLFISTGEEGNYVILMNNYDTQTEEMIDQSEENSNVVELTKTVDNKLLEAMTKDEKLKNFVEKLNAAASGTTSTPTASSKATITPAATKKN